jgi:hypothetical protein
MPSLTTIRPAALVAAIALLPFAVASAGAASPAASACPDSFFLSGNLEPNPELEIPQAGVPLGQKTCWENGGPPTPPAAAADWKMHSNNVGAKICSKVVNGGAPGSNGAKRLLVTADGNEGGVYRNVPFVPGKGYMFSVWVLVKSGQVAIQSSATTGGPVAWTSKTGEWEQLRVCNNSQFGVDQLLIYNQAGTGGKFYVDRVELREIPVRE